MTREAIIKVLQATALVCVAVGGSGSMLCVPFAITSSWNLVMIAGIYFVAGGVMITGGLITLALLLRTEG